MAQGTPAGWYDVGDGMVGMWDGERWTGERISHQQLAALSRPQAPPPPGPSYPPIGQSSGMPRWWGTPFWVWVILAVIAVIIGLPLLAAFAEGFTTGLSGGR